jgi:CRP-like cAMP-binding protein
MAGREEIVAILSQFTLFGDLTRAQLESVAGQLDERWFAAGSRILHQGLSGSGFHIVIEGECSVRVDGEERARLGRGDFFGEVTVLLGDPPSADVVALTAVRCLLLEAPDAEHFFLGLPRLMYRMMQVQARRLRAANAWRS